MKENKNTSCYRGTTKAHIIKVIRTRALRGSGTEEDPFVEAEQYWTLDGTFLWEGEWDTYGKK